MRIAMVSIALAFLLGGCVSAPFKEPPRVEIGGSGPWEVAGDFAGQLPEGFSLLNVLTFEYNFSRRITALGVISIDTAKREFTVVLMNPVGVKILELHADDAGAEERFALGKLSEMKGFAQVVAEDIRRIYLDLLPSPRASARKKKYEVIFSQPEGGGTLSYVFSGPGARLSDKKYHDEDGLSWKASYYDYRLVGGRLYPGGVLFINYKHHYRLIVRLKEVYGVGQQG